jgi:sugar lactone lactonase YvrE
MHVSTPTKILIALVALVSASSARAELAVVGRGPVYADAKGITFKAPEGVACSGSTVVVADTGNGRLVSFEWKDGFVSGGNELKVPQVTYPVRVELDGKGDILVLDRKARRIARLDPKGAFQGWLDPKGATGVVPVAFKLDASGNAYVVDGVTNDVLVLDPSGAVTRKIAPPKGKIFTDVAVDGAGTVFALDAGAAEVWFVEKGGSELKPLTKTMKDLMSFPAYLTTDGKGTLFVVDQNGNGIVLLGIDGSFLGRRLVIGWAEGAVYYPAEICFNPGGDMLLADRGNNRVQLFSVTR